MPAIFEDPFQWYIFINHVINNSKRSRPKKIKVFLDKVIEVSKQRIKIFDAEDLFYRARVGHYVQKTRREMLFPKKPYDGKDIGAPPTQKATEGRANPAKVSYLYLATDIETAVAEVKPYKGELVSVACFKLNKKVNLVDFTAGMSGGFFLSADVAAAVSLSGGANPDQIREIVWDQINHAFAKPISTRDSYSEYLPTQEVVRSLKKEGLDGIVYASSLTYTKGYNIVLFDKKLACQKPSSSRLIEVDQIKLEIKPYESNMVKRIKQAMHGMKP